MSGKIAKVGYSIKLDRVLPNPSKEMAVYKISWTNDRGELCQSGDWVGTISEAIVFCENKLKALYQKYYRYQNAVMGELPDA